MINWKAPERIFLIESGRGLEKVSGDYASKWLLWKTISDFVEHSPLVSNTTCGLKVI